jgi:hypothetical protein
VSIPHNAKFLARECLFLFRVHGSRKNTQRHAKEQRGHFLGQLCSGPFNAAKTFLVLRGKNQIRHVGDSLPRINGEAP